jgi:O-methyltransferase
MAIRRFLKKILGRAVLEGNTYRFLSLTILDSWPYVPLRNYLDIRKVLLFWKVCAHAQQNYASLSMAYDLTALVENSRLAGAIVECGAWRGGCAAVMATVADRAKSNRKVWLFDSFAGMPAATKEDVGDDATRLSRGVRSGALSPVGTNVASVEEVRILLFEKLLLKEENINIVKGWFQNTLPVYRDRIGAIAILRIDGDWYESTKVCIESLYDNVVKDGYVIIDDYGFFPGCKKAVDEFLERRHLRVQFNKADYSRVYFKKVEGPAALAGDRSQTGRD